jgi:hypothetical protein
MITHLLLAKSHFANIVSSHKKWGVIIRPMVVQIRMFIVCKTTLKLAKTPHLGEVGRCDVSLAAKLPGGATFGWFVLFSPKANRANHPALWAANRRTALSPRRGVFAILTSCLNNHCNHTPLPLSAAV